MVHVRLDRSLLLLQLYGYMYFYDLHSMYLLTCTTTYTCVLSAYSTCSTILLVLGAGCILQRRLILFPLRLFFGSSFFNFQTLFSTHQHRRKQFFHSISNTQSPRHHRIPKNIYFEDPVSVVPRFFFHLWFLRPCHWPFFSLLF